MIRALLAVLAATASVGTAQAQSKVDFYPSNPSSCAYQLSRVDLVSQEEDAEKLVVDINVIYQGCKERQDSTIYRQNITSDDDRVLVLHKDGFKTPWSYRAPVDLQTQVNGSIASARMIFEKAKILKGEESVQKSYLLVFTPKKLDSSLSFTWDVELDLRAEVSPTNPSRLSLKGRH